MKMFHKMFGIFTVLVLCIVKFRKKRIHKQSSCCSWIRNESHRCRFPCRRWSIRSERSQMLGKLLFDLNLDRVYITKCIAIEYFNPNSSFFRVNCRISISVRPINSTVVVPRANNERTTSFNIISVEKKYETKPINI